MKLGVVGLGLIGGSIALGLRDRHEVVGYDASADARAKAASRGLRVVDRIDDVVPADAVVVATPLATIVPTLEQLVPLARGAALIEVGSLKLAVAVFAERSPRDTRIVGLHPMAGSTSAGFDHADPRIFEDRPFLVVATSRSDDRAIGAAERIARDLGGTVVRCSARDHDRAVAAVSALPLATSIALAHVARAASPLDVAEVAGPGLHDTTRLAGTPPELAIPLLRAPGLREHLASLRSAIEGIERALDDEAALRALLDGGRGTPPRAS